MVKHQNVSEYYENDCSYKRCFECKAAEIESIITDITNLATNATLNTKTKRIESKIRDTASFVKKEKKWIWNVCFKLFSGKSCFDDDGMQNYLVLQPVWYTSKYLVFKGIKP